MRVFVNSNKGPCQQFNGTSLVACQYATRTCSLQGKLSETSPAAVRETLRRKFGHPGAGHRTGRLVGRQQPVAPSVSHRWWDAIGSGASDWWALLLLQLRPGPSVSHQGRSGPFPAAVQCRGLSLWADFCGLYVAHANRSSIHSKRNWRGGSFWSSALARWRGPFRKAGGPLFNCHTANSLVGRGPPQPAHRPQSRRSK